MSLDLDAFEKCLQTVRFGRSVCALDATTSTNDDARREGQKGAPDGHLVIAEVQTSGRGRKGRQWCVPPEVNLTFSFVVRPKIPLERVPSLTLCAAVGCREAIREVCGIDVGIKWPNDLVFEGKKLCGILSEMSLRPGGSHEVDFAVIGMGLNVNTDPRFFPPPLDQTATSLRQILGKSLSREVILAALMNHLEEALDSGFSALFDRYCAGSSTLGTRVRATLDSGETVDGIAEGLTDAGALLLRVDGEDFLREITAGDVEHLRKAPTFLVDR